MVDGDTIKIKINDKEETVRFLLVDTPETKHPKYGVQPFGKEASYFTKQLLTEKDCGA
nr:thermonuclease family protein [Brevibacillus brevis]